MAKARAKAKPRRRKTSSKTVRVACAGAETRALDALIPLQGELKKLSAPNAAKLRRQIEELGFSEPIAVWGDRVLNGHQRLAVLQQMRDDGWTVPPVPVCLVEAKDEAEARRKILSLTSQFGEITTDGLEAFLAEMKLGTEEALAMFRFPEIPAWAMEDGPPDWKQAMGALPKGERGSFQQMTFTLHDAQIEIVKQAMRQAQGAGPFEDGLNDNSNGNALARIAEAYLDG